MFRLPRPLVAGLALLLVSLPAMAPATTLSTNPATIAAFTSADPGARLRAYTASQEELYVGRQDLGVGSNRTAANLTYLASQNFVLAYTASTGQVTAGVGAVSRSYLVGKDIDFNALRIDITGPRNNSAGGSNAFSIAGLTVNGTLLGDLAGATTNPRRTLTWIVGGVTGDLVLAGTLLYSGPLLGNGSAEGAKVDLRLGNLPPVPLPAALPLMLLALGGLALAARRRRRV